MTARATFKVTNREAPRRAADPYIEHVAEGMRDELVNRSPRDTGRYASAWQVLPGRGPGIRLVANATPYARFVEFGTIHEPARPVFGQVLAETRARFR